MKIQTFTKSYEGRRVLEVPELELEGGKIYGVIGANGSGKSTFAKVLAGVAQADIPGRKTEKGLRLGYMPQKNYAFRMSVRENIFLGKRDEKRAAELMEALGISHLADKRARLLSGGETARMALARLMMQDFRLLILDEPTAAMDMESSLLAEKLMGDYCRRSGCALVLITHSLQQAERMADELLFFHEGRLLERGEKRRLLSSPAGPELRRFLDFYGSGGKEVPENAQPTQPVRRGEGK